MLIYSILMLYVIILAMYVVFKNTLFYLKMNNKRKFFYLQIHKGYKMR